MHAVPPRHAHPARTHARDASPSCMTHTRQHTTPHTEEDKRARDVCVRLTTLTTTMHAQHATIHTTPHRAQATHSVELRSDARSFDESDMDRRGFWERGSESCMCSNCSIADLIGKLADRCGAVLASYSLVYVVCAVCVRGVRMVCDALRYVYVCRWACCVLKRRWWKWYACAVFCGVCLCV